jgi:RNA polymerase sigma-70 factor, ECF subfamily
MLTGTSLRTNETELLEQACAGDEEAFRRLIEPHRADLHAHCYRMLGSLHDADDALQDALLRAWRGLPKFEGRSATSSWLHRITTNACLDAITRRRKRVLPIDYGPPSDPGGEPGEPLAEQLWVEPYPDSELGLEAGYAAPEARYERREAVELAFIAALQHLPPRQRAVLILREVLGFSARETADTLDTTPASVNSALQRARKVVEERLPERSQQATMRSLGSEAARELVERFISAFERGDVAAIVALLADDAEFAMPPYAEWQRGRDAVSESWLMPEGPAPRLRYGRTRANGQLAVGAYALDEEAGAYLPIALDVLALRGDAVAQVIAFRTPAVFERFGLAPSLPAG